MVKNKLLKRWAARAGALLSVLLLLCCMVLPASAFTSVDDDTSYTELINVGRFSVCTFIDNYQVPYAYSVIDSDSSTGFMSYSWNTEDFDEEVSWRSTIPSSTSGAYYATQIVGSPGGNWQKISFRNTQPFVLSQSEWELLQDYFTVTVPDVSDFTFTVSFTGYYPVEHSDGGYRWTHISGENVILFDYENFGEGTYTPVPFLSGVVNDDGFSSVFGKGIYCTELTFTIELYSYSSVLGEVRYSMPYLDSVNCVRPLDYFRQFPRESTTTVVVEDLSATSIGSFLATAAGGFFGVEIVPGLSLGAILAAIIGVMILVAFLKFR